MYNQTAARHTSETNRTSERNYDSGVFSDEENDPRRSTSDRMTKASISTVSQNATIASRGAKNSNTSAEYLNNKRKKTGRNNKQKVYFISEREEHGVVVRALGLYWSGIRFESLSSHHCWTLSKSFITSLVVWSMAIITQSAKKSKIEKKSNGEQ